jgi:glycosyltransferase involved in cell wall biosynthesis
MAPELVYVVSLDLLPWAALLRRFSRIRVLYDSSEQYDAYMLTKGYLPDRLRPPLSRVVRWLEPWLARRLDGATTAVPATQEKFVAAGVRSQLVRNFPPRELTKMAVERGPFEYDVMVGGSLHEDGVAVLAETAAKLVELSPGDVRWLAVCRNYDEPKKEHLERSLTGAGVRHLFDLRYDLPFQEVQQLTTTTRVGLIGYPDRPYYRIALPLRVLEYMAVGLPFVTARFELVDQLVGGEEVGAFEPPGDAGAYAVALADLLGDEPRRERMTLRGPEIVRERLNWENEGRALVEFVDRSLS